MPNIFEMTIKEIYNYIFELKREIEVKQSDINKLNTIISTYEEREADYERGSIPR
jgi:hypothetical protein